MRAKRRAFRKWLVVATLTFPLLQTTSTCIDMTARTFINGFFDAVVPILDSAADQFVVASAASDEAGP